MKFIRIIFSIIALLVVLLVVALVLFAIFVNPDRLNPVLADTLKQQTGYEVIVDGPSSWSFYPNLGVTVSHIAFSVSKQANPFIDLQHITFVTKLAGLLHGQLDHSHLYIANVRLFNVQLQKADVGLQWQNQQLTLKPLQAVLYGGTLNGEALGLGLSTMPRWAVSMQAMNVALKPLLQDVNGSNSKMDISGVAEIDIRATIQGKTREQLLASTNGTMTFHVTQGAVDGLDANGLIKNAEAIINRQPEALTPMTNATIFDRLAGTFVIANGIATTRDLALSAPAFMIQGSGAINLVANAMDLTLRITPQNQTTSQWVIPVKISGDMSAPNVNLDITQLNLDAAKEKLDQTIHKVRDKINEQLPNGASDVLPFLGR